MHITPPHCSISPRRTSTYLISWREAHSHPSVRMCNLPPYMGSVCVHVFVCVRVFVCVCLMHLSGCSCGHPRKTVCTLRLCATDEQRAILHALWRLLAPFCPMCARSASESILLHCFFFPRKFPELFSFHTERHQWRETALFFPTVNIWR